MSTHAHFEELCVLATTGQLSAAESDRLNQHLIECDPCRSFLKDAHLISDRMIPHVLRFSRDEVRVPAGMRERFLARATKNGLPIHAGPPVTPASPPVEPEPRSRRASVSNRFLSPHILVGSLQPWQAWALVASVCSMCFALGMVVRTPSKTVREVRSATASPPPQITQAPLATDSERNQIHELTTEREQHSRQISDLTSQLEKVSKEKQQVEAALEQRLSAVQSQAANDHNALARETAALGARASELQSQLDILRQQQSLADADLKNARAKTAEYSARLDLVQEQLRNQEASSLPSSDEIRGLVAARNLHIIDVYDSNTAGKRQRAFGRVFYVEGRSLVFYAYDLTAAHSQKNITFHLWGEKAGSKETTLNLGILHDDDPHERRWALTFDDPKALAKINSVYVTAESESKHSDAPQGPRVLYAFLGAEPNHP